MIAVKKKIKKQALEKYFHQFLSKNLDKNIFLSHLKCMLLVKFKINVEY